MPVPVTLFAFLVAFAGASALAAHMRAGTKWMPHAVLAGIAFVLFFELARYDQGYSNVLYWVGFLVAPILAIFGGAAWGSRRVYGWPDLGPSPSRAALVSAAVLVGVLMGVRTKVDDVQKSEAALKAWVQHGAVGVPPRTTLGFLAPPEPEKGLDEDGDEVWGFPVGNQRWRLMKVDALTWKTATAAPRARKDQRHVPGRSDH